MSAIGKLFLFIERIAKILMPRIFKKGTFTTGDEFPMSEMKSGPPITPCVYEVFPQALYAYIDKLCEGNKTAQILAHQDDTQPWSREEESGKSSSKIRSITVEQCGASSGLPSLNEGALQGLFEHLIGSEDMYQRDENLLERHPRLKESNRTHMIKWISNVCGKLGFSKRKFYVAVDFIDRYLGAASIYVSAKYLELVTLASFRLAVKEDMWNRSKYLESLPMPGYTQWSDGQITEMEDNILTTLRHQKMPVTTDMWIAYLLQYCKELELGDGQELNTGFFGTTESQRVFVSCSRICSCSIVETQSFRYSYRILAASSLWLFKKTSLVFQLAGLTWDDVSPCVSWMLPFYQVVVNLEMDGLKHPWGSPHYWQLNNFPFNEVYVRREAFAIEQACNSNRSSNPRVAQLLRHREDVAKAVPLMTVSKKCLARKVSPTRRRSRPRSSSLIFAHVRRELCRQ